MTNLRIPGPTPLPEEVLKASSQQMISHRGHKYEEIQARVVENLKHFFQTKNDIFLLTSSGTGGLEASIANFFSPKETVVAFTCGEFGNRWAEIARRFWTNCIQVKFPLGQAVSKDEVYRLLETQIDIAGVLITHNETATGVVNPIADLAPLIKTHRSKPLLLVDSISAMGAVDLPVDDLDIDVVVSASQKAWMAPPGLSMIAVSKAAWERQTKAQLPRYYFDLSLAKEFAEKNQTPATPAVSTLYALDTSLEMMRKEGREKIFSRHLSLMKYFRSEVQKMGLDLFVSDHDASPTVTSIKVPAGIDAKKWLEILKEKYKVILAGGMGETKGKIIRAAHMGYVSKKEIVEVIEALKESLKEIH